jgi:hypothetical protein
MTREELKNAAEIVLTCEPEDIAIEGNVLTSGNDAADKEAERQVREELENGNEWAWCCAHVKATLGPLSGHAFLGACSYKNREDFQQPGGYYPEMVEEALDDLWQQIQTVKAL